MYKYINLTETYEENSETSFLGWDFFGVKLWTYFVLQEGSGSKQNRMV